MAGRPMDRVVAWVSRRKLYRLVVLGPEAVGKTTLLNWLRGTWHEDELYEPTLALGASSTARVTSNGDRLMLPDLRDLSGKAEAYPVWEERAERADIVVYLVNAVHLYAYQQAVPAVTENWPQIAADWQRIVDDASQIEPWLWDRCIVVVTHRDMDPRFAEAAEPNEGAYLATVEKQLGPIVNSLGGPRRVRLVAGSLNSRANAKKLTNRIMEQLR